MQLSKSLQNTQKRSGDIMKMDGLTVITMNAPLEDPKDQIKDRSS